ncbi:complex I NDUFA9 subunit family protein [Breoghania sp. L-A4]|uniref:complex I NDUFA9 subunit family protein n=1 Tax=Breoghania sp. L-A4 TaxID=2304600 RepID=UPI000E359760|nr:complex I NDUFA9 subunit family protein [Breoghania sp. L-A4]AXS39149.1 complex I NDUFA9 subunit family protein [Breoghania sp. L-A4]
MTTALNGKLATVFGGSGFVGRHVVRALAQRGWRIRVAVRRPDLAGFLQPMGGVGQIQPVQANLRYRWSVDQAVDGADAVINLVGVLAQSGKQTFDAVHAFGAGAVAEAARGAGIANVVHLSAIGADAQSNSGYARSKAAGEAAVRETLKAAVIMRPSIVFGPEDDFFNRFAGMARMSPALPLIGGGETKFQPVFVGDVAEAIARAVEGEARAGATYELGGPQVKSFRECLELMLEIIGRKRLLLPVPFAAARMIGRVAQRLPGAPLTLDQVRMLEHDNVVSSAAREAGLTLDGLGIQPDTMAAILPSYLWRFREHGQYDAHPIV